MRTKSYGEEKRGVLDSLIYGWRTRNFTSWMKKNPGFRAVVDLGCGYRADLLKNLQLRFPPISHAVGIDISTDSSVQTSSLILMNSNLNSALPLQSDSADLVLSSAVLEHLDNYDLAAKEMYRIIRPNGHLLLTTPSPLSKYLLEFMAYKLNIINDEEIRDHKRYFSRKMLTELFLEVGFRTVSVNSFQFGLNSFVICQK